MATRFDHKAQDFLLGDFLVQPQLNRINRNGETVQVEPKVMRVLLCMAERPGQVVTREELLSAVWGDAFVSEQVLSRSISELRKLLADDAREMIETIPKTGYRLVAPVTPGPVTQGPAAKDAGPEFDRESNRDVGPRIDAPAQAATGDRALAKREIAGEAQAPPAAHRWGLWLTLVVLGLLLCAFAWAWWRIERESSGPLMRLTLDLAETIPPELDIFESFAISPDGSLIVFVGRRDGKYQLFERPLARSQATAIPGTEGGYGPFFSPDGKWLGFYAGGLLRKIQLGGGSQSIIGGPADDAVGASWGEDGAVVFTRRVFEGLYRVSSGGGEVKELTRLDKNQGERSHLWPEVLPDAKAVIFTVWKGGDINNAEIALLSLADKTRRTLIEGGARARYLPTGHLAYVRRSQLFVVPFDIDRLVVTGAPAPMQERVGMNLITGAGHYAVARTGLLLYLPDRVRRQDLQLLWVDRAGSAQPVRSGARGYWTPRISPDGARVAFGEQGESLDLWIEEFSGGALRRLTFGRSNFAPVWSPDGRRIVFSSDAHGGPLNIYWRASDGSDEAARLTESGNPQFPGSWTPDGRSLLYAEIDAETRWDIWRLDLKDAQGAAGAQERGAPQPWLRTKDDEMHPAVSPDGRWIAYTSSETGKWQVFVRSFPEAEGKWQISTEGGVEPRWRGDGRELYFRSGDKIMAVDVTTGEKFSAARPRELFAGKYQLETVSMLPGYDVAPDGNRFIMLKSESAEQPTRLQAVLNWFTSVVQK